MSLYNWSELRSSAPQVIRSEVFEIYKDYVIGSHPVHGFQVVQNGIISIRLNREMFDTLEKARAFVDGLPPAPTFSEIIRGALGKRSGRSLW